MFLRSAFGLTLQEVKDMVERGPGSFTPYLGVKELEGKGYFPSNSDKPYPIEAGEVLGYNVTNGQQVEYPIGWAITYWPGIGYNVVPIFPEDAALGFNTLDGKVVVPYALEHIVHKCKDLSEAINLRGLLVEARKAGREDIKSAVIGVLDTYD